MILIPRRPGRSSLPSVALCMLVAIALGAAPLFGNGGTLRLANVTMGAYVVSVFTDPTPVRPDSLDVSVLVLREGLDGVAEDVEVWVRSRPADHPQEVMTVLATREQADDPRYRAAKFALAHPGRWEIEVEVAGEGGRGSATFEVSAREPGILGNPLVLILLSLAPIAGAGWWLMRDEEGIDTGRDQPETG